MNTRKTVYNKLFTEKTELAKHEVELVMVDDLKKNVLSVDRLHTEFIKEYNEILKLKNKIIQTADNFIQYSNTMNENANLLNQKFKQLGLRYDDSNEYKEAARLSKYLSDVKSKADKIKQL